MPRHTMCKSVALRKLVWSSSLLFCFLVLPSILCRAVGLKWAPTLWVPGVARLPVNRKEQAVLLDRWIPAPRVLHPYPDKRFDAIYPRVRAVCANAHVRICGGGRPVMVVPTATVDGRRKTSPLSFQFVRHPARGHDREVCNTPGRGTINDRNATWRIRLRCALRVGDFWILGGCQRCWRGNRLVAHAESGGRAHHAVFCTVPGQHRQLFLYHPTRQIP